MSTRALELVAPMAPGKSSIVRRNSRTLRGSDARGEVWGQGLIVSENSFTRELLVGDFHALARSGQGWSHPQLPLDKPKSQIP